MHGRANAIAIAQVDIVAHPDLVAVVQDGRAGKREQDTLEQLNTQSAILHQRRQPSANADIDSHARIGAVGQVHVVAFFVANHLEGQLVVIAQKQAPLTAVGYARSLPHDFGDGVAIFEAQAHEQSGHQRKMEGHMAFITVAKVRQHVAWPLVGLGQDHAVLVARIHGRADFANDSVGFGKIFAGGVLALNKVGDGV